MVLGSASLPGKRKVLGLKPTLENLSDLFNGKIWPKLASWDDDGGPAVYHLKALYSQEQANIDDSLAVLPFALSHGLNPSVPPAPPTPSQAYPPGKPTSFFSKRYSLPLNGYFPALSLQPAKSPSSSPRDRSPSASGERPVFTSPFAPERAYVERLNEAQEGNEERDGSDYDTATQGSTSHDEAESPSPLPPPSSLLPRKEPALSPTSEVPPSADVTTSSSSSLAPSTPPSSSTPSSSSKLQITTPDVGVSRAEELRERPRAARSISGRSRRPRTAQGSETGLGGRGATTAARAAASGTKAPPRRVSIDDESPPALDSTAFFITNRRTGRDVLFFGDVEPDCISRSPRNRRVWAHAAPRFVEKNLNTIFLECSFPASHPTQFLYGHLSVNHLFDEIRTLSRIVVAEKKRRLTRRQPAPPPPPSYPRSKLSVSQLPPIPASPMAASSVQDSELHGSLEGLSIVIVHVKTALFPSFEASPPSSSSPSSGEEVEQRPRVVDPRTMQQRILEELRDMEHDVGLGVRFEMAKQGMRIDC
ncbi:hypothetical protein L7F22_031499 [Adiantum nelumboides]|nr:hypothetical protein [Adiantum nelumboides]